VPLRTGVYGEYTGYTSTTSMGAYNRDQGAMGSSFYASTSSAPAGIGGRTPTTATRKGTDTLIMMGTGTSGMWYNHVVVANKGESIQGMYDWFIPACL
jgi:hypothetical protein